VKIDFKFQSLGKISNISTSDPPVLFGQCQHWIYHIVFANNHFMANVTHSKILESTSFLKAEVTFKFIQGHREPCGSTENINYNFILTFSRNWHHVSTFPRYYHLFTK